MAASQMPPPLRNGHVLHIYFQHQRSVTVTTQQLSSILGSDCVVKPAQVHHLLQRTIPKYANLSRESDRRHFLDVCNQDFSFHTGVPPSPQEAPSASFDEPHLSEPSTSQVDQVSPPAVQTVSEVTAEEEPSASSTPSSAVLVRTSQRTTLTPQQMKTPLSSLTRSFSDLKKRYQASVRSQLKSISVQRVKILNQDIKPKKKIFAKKRAVMAVLRKEIKSGPDMEQLDKLRKQLSNMKEKHMQLKKYHQNKEGDQTSAHDGSDGSAKTVQLLQRQRSREVDQEKAALQQKLTEMTNGHV